MKYLFLLAALLSTTAYAEDKKQPSKYVVQTCNTLGTIYDTSYKKALDGVNYTDLIFSVSVQYEGSPEGLYLIMHTIEDAYTDVRENVSEEEGKTNNIHKCLDNDLIKSMDDKIKGESEESKIPKRSQKFIT